MAKFVPGPLAGQISGSLASQVFSHGRGGPYIRRRATPVNRKTLRQKAVRASLETLSRNWQLLAAANQASWSSWALTNQVVNTLGHKIVLTGHQAYIQTNIRLQLVGNLVNSAAPGTPAPAPLISATLTASAGGGTCSLAYTPTPTPADVGLWITAVLLHSPGICYIENRLKFLVNIGAAHASPIELWAPMVALFGTPAVGNKIVMMAFTFQTVTGLLSQPLRAECIVAA